MAKAKKEEEHVPKPSTITYHLAIPEIKEDMMTMLLGDKKPPVDIFFKLKGDAIIIQYTRELSLDEAVYIGAILGKWEMLLIDKLNQNSQ